MPDQAKACAPVCSLRRELNLAAPILHPPCPPEAELNPEQSKILYTFREKQVPRLSVEAEAVRHNGVESWACGAYANGRSIVTEYIVLEYEYGGRPMPCHDHD